MGQHQGSALSTCLFANVKDRMTDEHQTGDRTLMFADDILI